MNDGIVDGIMQRGLVLKALGGALPETRKAIANHDEAQREALARVEANLKREKAEAWELCGIVDARTEERDTAKAHLAEAVGLLREIEAAKIIFNAERFALNRRLVALLASHAQAEQQETREPSAAEAIDSLTQPLCVISLRGDDRQKALATDLAKIIRQYHGHDQEAQGAQAGEFQREDRYIVIKRKDLEAIERSGEASDLETHEAVRFLAEALDTLRPHLPAREYLVIESDWPEYEPTWAAIQARMTGQGERVGDELVAFKKWFAGTGLAESWGEPLERVLENAGNAYASCCVGSRWHAWKARAALATQPAAEDHDQAHQLAFEVGEPDEDGDGYHFSAEQLDEFVSKLNAVRGAEQ